MRDEVEVTKKTKGPVKQSEEKKDAWNNPFF